MALVEERKRLLAAEGLFDADRKQPLPFLPRIIGVVTSPTGAVIRDILHRLADRFPRQVLVWPVKVQGEGSAEEVATAIRGFNALPEGGAIPRPDVLIVARGGGSLEDLWSFNEEIVVRAAAESMIPLIAAVGHETDVTLIDFAADKRAPTPTAAAEMAVPVRAELAARLASLAGRNVACWLSGLQARRTELRAAVRALPTKDGLLALPRQRLDVASERLPLALKANAQLHHARFSRTAARLQPAALQVQLAGETSRIRICAERARNAFAVLQRRRRDRFQGAMLRLAAGVRANAQAHAVAVRHDRTRVAALMRQAHRAIDVALDRRYAQVDAIAQLLAAFSYRGVLDRGFALVRDGGGKPLRAAASVTANMALDIEFADGRVGAVAGDARSMRPAAAPLRRRRRSGVAVPGQGSLFD
jgi:exodeoxyribonuclease VII large subunit